MPLSLPTKIYDGDFVLQASKVREFYLGPSHTPDDIFVDFPAERNLYAGNILNEQVGNPAFANIPAYGATLEKLESLDLNMKYVISGHWSPVHGQELIDQYLGFLRQAKSNSN